MTDKRATDAIDFMQEIGNQLPEIRTAHALEKRRTARHFSVINLLEPGEVQISRLFANLLDPTGSHGQGALFLNRLAKAVDLDDINPDEEHRVRVKLEALTPGNRRIDILIHYPGHWWIGIENKPWAGEQWNQLTDYQAEVKRLAQGSATGENWQLVYFSDRAPENPDGLDTKRFHPFSFLRTVDCEGKRSLATIFDPGSAEHAELPANLRMPLEQIGQYLGWRDLETKTMTSNTSKFIVDHATSSDKSRESLAHIFLSGFDFYSSEISRYNTILQSRIKDHFPAVKFDGSLARVMRPHEAYDGLTISLPEWGDALSICFESDGLKSRGWFGLFVDEEIFKVQFQNISIQDLLKISENYTADDWSSNKKWVIWKWLMLIDGESRDLSIESFYKELIKQQGGIDLTESRILSLAEDTIRVASDVNDVLTRA